MSCLREGCTTHAVKTGRLCFKHTVKLSCADPDCETPQVLGKFVCTKHGTLDTAQRTRASWATDQAIRWLEDHVPGVPGAIAASVASILPTEALAFFFFEVNRELVQRLYLERKCRI